MTFGDARLPERFWSKISVNEQTGCWVWTGWNNGIGYGRFKHNKAVYTHRLAYETANGPLPEGLVIDHLCRNPPCCNPSHLEAVTQQENTVRGDAGAAVASRQKAKTHCPKGHAYDDENTRVDRHGKRHCRACERVRWNQESP